MSLKKNILTRRAVFSLMTGFLYISSSKFSLADQKVGSPFRDRFQTYR